MTDKEVMQMALDTMLAAIKAGDWKVDGACDPDYVLEALRTALAQGEQEPFGYFKAEPFGWTDCAETDEGAIPLYERPVAPPQREWQGLTDEEIRNEAKNHVFDESFFSGAIWARGKMMGKNYD